MESLTLKELTLKTVALIALTSSDRGQTIHLAKINRMHIDEKYVEFYITERIKTTGRILSPTTIRCVSSLEESKDVAKYVLHYMEKTLPYRDETSQQLFISHTTYKPVCRNTIARWLKKVLHLAGIDTSIFKAHSYRGASLSHAFNKGAPIEDITKAGNWKKSSTFFKNYFAPSSSSTIGNLILESQR